MHANRAPEPQPRPWQAVVQARLVRGVGADRVEEVDYDGEGRFMRRLRVTRGPGPGVTVVLDRAQLRQLLAQLRSELAVPAPGVDSVSVELFTCLVEDAVRREPPSNRFDGALFGEITRDEGRGILYGHVSLGVDLIGTVRDDRHHLSFEQQVVTGPAGAYRLLSPADCASLARALAVNPPADPLWQEVRRDAEVAAGA
jgi:hypothetical protein